MNNQAVTVIRSLLRNPSALAGLLIIAGGLLIAVLGANIRPDDSPDANDQQVSLARLKPFSVAKFLVIHNDPVAESNFFSRMFFGGKEETDTYIPFDSLYFEKDLIYYFPYSRTGRVDSAGYRKSVSIVPFLVTGADSSNFKNGVITIYKSGVSKTFERTQFIRSILTGNTTTRFYFLGTDTFGRDLLSRIMAGTIVSLSVGLIAVLVSLVLGIVLGGLAGYYGGWTDKVIMWFVNVIWSVPTLLMVIAITVALGKGFTQVFIAVGFTMWVEVARVVRGQFIQLREKDYITATRLMGFSDIRIIFRHLLPNALAPLIVISAGNFSTAILLESGLSFLGVGAQVPMPSWGGIIKSHFNYITTDYAYLALIPGFCLSLLTLAFMLVGNGLRDALDVRSVEA
ncbi:MAG: ABC transporter permease [Bacteroidota bacterium]